MVLFVIYYTHLVLRDLIKEIGTTDLILNGQIIFFIYLPLSFAIGDNDFSLFSISRRQGYLTTKTYLRRERCRRSMGFTPGETTPLPNNNQAAEKPQIHLTNPYGKYLLGEYRKEVHNSLRNVSCSHYNTMIWLL